MGDGRAQIVHGLATAAQSPMPFGVEANRPHATIGQLERSAREAGFDVYTLPPLPNNDFHRSIQQRLSDGPIHRAFLEAHDIRLGAIVLLYGFMVIKMLGEHVEHYRNMR